MTVVAIYAIVTGGCLARIMLNDNDNNDDDDERTKE